MEFGNEGGDKGSPRSPSAGIYKPQTVARRSTATTKLLPLFVDRAAAQEGIVLQAFDALLVV
jgi:hypothetical protein